MSKKIKMALTKLIIEFKTWQVYFTFRCPHCISFNQNFNHTFEATSYS